jgi:group I intron endonuclease
MKGIYKITSPSNKIYIGQSHNIEKRKSNYKRLVCKAQPKIYNSLKKYGFDNHQFEIIHELPNDVEQIILDNYEEFYIELYKNTNTNMLNLKDGGSRGKHSEETKAKMRGRIIPKEERIKISNSLKGQEISTERRYKISNTLKNRIYSDEVINTFKQNVHSDKSRLKASLTRTGKKYPKKNRPTIDELKNLIATYNLKEIGEMYKVSSVTIKNWLNEYEIKYTSKTNEKRKIKIVEKDLNGNICLTFDSISLAAEYYKKHPTSISDRIKNKTIFDSKTLEYL